MRRQSARAKYLDFVEWREAEGRPLVDADVPLIERWAPRPLSSAG